jgi:hypothetical protein
MTAARASHLRLVVNEPVVPAVRQAKLRFRPVVKLADGSAYGMHAETDIAFEDTLQPRHFVEHNLPSAGGWLGDIIERCGKLASDTDTRMRPISVSAPMAALADRDAPMAAEAGVLRAGLLAQEIRIDFVDSSVVALEDLALDRIDAFRRRGFRVGLDARKSWRTPMGARARMTFEAVRLEPARMEALDIPMSRMEVAAADGVAIIAENIRWRDAEKIAEYGILYALAPRADS